MYLRLDKPSPPLCMRSDESAKRTRHRIEPTRPFSVPVVLAGLASNRRDQADLKKKQACERFDLLLPQTSIGLSR